MGHWRTLGIACLLQAAFGLMSADFAPAQTAAPRNSQVQVSRHFLRALLKSDYANAYAQLAPEVRQAVSAARFRELARPLAGRGKRRGPNIELYKMGMRLDESGPGQGGQLFVAWAWAADAASARRLPPEWLEVTFRDSAARQVLGFGLRHR